MDEPSVQQATTARDTVQLGDAVRFDRAALLIGRSLYWSQSPQDNAAGLGALLQWCLNLPGARLGVSAAGVATIVRDVLATSPAHAPHDVRQTHQLLARFGVHSEDANPWPQDALIWKPDDIGKLIGWLEQTPRVNEPIWVDPKDVDWWIAATMESLNSYSALFARGFDRDAIMTYISRHLCTVFAPFDGAATWDQFATLVSTLPSDQQQRYLDMLADASVSRARLAEIQDVYWSWRLTDFSNVDGSIICTPMLALWSEWPSSAQWAPQTLVGVTERRRLTGEEVTFLLTDAMWLRIETVLNLARDGCGLGIAEPEFAEKECRPPVFFFASPSEVPAKPEEYGESLQPAIMPLVRACLRAADPLADQVAWGLLQGDVVALRRETSASSSYQPWYLLLPAYAKSAGARPIEEDLYSVTDRLTYIEFSIAHEARDVYTDLEPLAVRLNMWGGTLDAVNSVVGEALDLLPSTQKSHFTRLNEHLAALHLVLRRLQTSIETGASDTNQVRRKYTSYLDATEDYLRLRLLFSSVPRIATLNLSHAIQHAYPYEYLRQPLEALNSTMSQVSSGANRINASLNTILELSDRRIQALSSRLSGLFNFIIALLALLVGLAQVIGSQTGASTAPGATTSTSLFGPLVQSPELSSAARLLFEVVGLLLIATAVLYSLEWSIQRLPRRRHRFFVDMQTLRALVSASEGYVTTAMATGQNEAWNQVELIDDEGVQILGRLWKELRLSAAAVQGGRAGGVGHSPRRARMPGVREWEFRVRLLEQAIELFDLAPRFIPLPRTLCVLRFKSTDFRARTAISDWDFDISLRTLGYSSTERSLLQSWLSIPANQQLIRVWDVAAVAAALKEHGLRADPGERRPDRWYGGLDGQ